jgi:hypothetical protein
MTHPENPPAFPMPAAEHSQGGHFEQHGMSLRDWFAGRALTGICMWALPLALLFPKWFASWAAYWIADAMLAERAKDGAK